MVAVVEEDASAGQFRVGVPGGVVLFASVIEGGYQESARCGGWTALLERVVKGKKILVETSGIGDGEFYVLGFGELDEFGGFFEVSGRGWKLEDIEFLFYCGSEVLIAAVQAGGDEEAIELVLDYQLAVVIVEVAFVFFGEFFGKVSVFIGDGLDFEAASSRSRCEQ